jgi:N12 class adenine-specific DNA methylase
MDRLSRLGALMGESSPVPIADTSQQLPAAPSRRAKLLDMMMTGKSMEVAQQQQQPDPNFLADGVTPAVVKGYQGPSESMDLAAQAIAKFKTQQAQSKLPTSPESSPFYIDELAKLTPQERQDYFKSKGEIGIGETLGERDLGNTAPFLSGINAVVDLAKVKTALDRVKAGQASETDTRTLRQYIFAQEAEQARGRTLGGEVTKLVADMVPFAAEIGMTGGIAGIGKKAVTEATEASLKKTLGVKLGGFAAKELGTIGAAAGYTLANPQRVAQAYMERTTPRIMQDETGNIKITKEGQEPAKALLKAVGETALSYWTEQKGEQLVGAAGKLAGKIPGAGRAKDFLDKLSGSIGAVIGKTPEKVLEMMQKAQWSGILGEMSEEQLDKSMREVFALNDVHDDTNTPYWERVASSLKPDGRELLTQFIAFSIPGAAGRAAGAAQKLASGSQKAQSDTQADLSTTDATQTREQRLQQIMTEPAPEIAPPDQTKATVLKPAQQDKLKQVINERKPSEETSNAVNAPDAQGQKSQGKEQESLQGQVEEIPTARPNIGEPSKPGAVVETAPTKESWQETREKIATAFNSGKSTEVDKVIKESPTADLVALSDSDQKIADDLVRQEIADRYNSISHEAKLKLPFSEWKKNPDAIQPASPPVQQPESGLDKSKRLLGDAIEKKDVDTLIKWLHTGNKNLREHFREKTGIKLPKTEGGTKEAIRQWAKQKPDQKETVPGSIENQEELPSTRTEQGWQAWVEGVNTPENRINLEKKLAEFRTKYPEKEFVLSQTERGSLLIQQRDIDTDTDKVVESKQEKSNAEPQKRAGELGQARRSGESGTKPYAQASTEPLQNADQPGQVDQIPDRDAGPSRDILPESTEGGEADRGNTGSDQRDLDKPAGQQPRRTDSASSRRDYRIATSDKIGEGGAKTKFRNNVEAIRILKQIESEGRIATAEEQAKLIKYVGWGGMPQSFDEYKSDWAKEYRELKEMLTDEEYRAARASTPNAHYTSPEIVSSIWKGLEQMGFKGGRISEPSMGTGIFYGMIPDSIAANSKLFGVELDSISGRISKQLYQNANIQINGFEKVKYADNFFDLFISNVPFGDYKLFDQEFKSLNFNIHDFFFAKALKKTRPGGLVAFITSKGTMDKLDSSVRKYIADRADLVAAIRLPRNTFHGIANTEVVTDIIILQKRADGQQPAGKAFNKVVDYNVGTETFRINEYFAEHPEHVLGKLSYTGSMYRGDELTVEPQDNINVTEQVASILASARTPQDIQAAQKKIDTDMHQADYQKLAPENVRDGAYFFQNGKIFRKDGQEAIPLEGGAAVQKRIGGLIRVRDAARKLLAYQIDPGMEDASINAVRKELNTAYDRFTKEFGAVSYQYNRRAFEDDPDLPLLLSLEHYDAEAKRAEKATIFKERTQFPRKTIERADTIEDAISASMGERGKLDTEYMSKLLGKTEEQIIEEIHGGLAYINPETGSVEPSWMYLSGNVRAKLKAAQSAAQSDPIYKPNAEALKNVQPEDISPGEIDARLGASWVDESDYVEFVSYLTGSRRVRFNKIVSDGSWIISGADNNPMWATNRVPTSDLVIQAMNGKEPNVYDKDPHGNSVLNQEETVAARSMQQKIKDEFRKWLWDDQSRAERLARKYNDMFNNLVFPQWSGDYLTLPGQVEHIKLRKHQKDVVARFLTNGNLLMAHSVGAGKTFAGITMAMEARRLGTIKKAVFVVPNHKVDDWRRDWMALYPSANVLAATKKDFEPANRQTLINRIATGNWDGIIVPMSSFEKVPLSLERVQAFYNDQIDQLEEDIRSAKSGKADRSIIKALEKAKKALQALMDKQLADWKKDKGPFFDELGIDMLFVDEAQEYKNLFFKTKKGRIAGIPQNRTQRAFDMYMKTQFINETTGNKGLVFATGTPITNSVSEMFNMQRYLQPQVLGDSGIASFDFWANNFGDTVTSVEVDPTGNGFRVHTRFAKFTNIPELLQMFRSMADIRTNKHLNLPLPKLKGGRPIVIQAPDDPQIQEYVQGLSARAEAIRSGKVDPREDNMLAITNDGRHVALDPRLRIQGGTDNPDSKVNLCVAKVHEIWKEQAKDRAIQVIWCDLSTPGKGWSIYDEIKQKLVDKSVPVEEIGFIHDADNDKKLAAFYDKANAGKIRIILASTSKMGTGANIQKRLVAAHHLTPPWRPADLEQRDGRIIRQGNQHEEVYIFRYVTKGSFDAYMWQTLETKAKFIDQIMNGDATAREMEDVGEDVLSYAEVKALASGNPKILEAVQLEADVKKLQALEKAHKNEQFALRRELKTDLPSRIDFNKKMFDAASKDWTRAKPSLEKAGEDVDFEFNGTQYTKRKEAGKALMEELGKLNKLSNQGGSYIGKAYGFKLNATWSQPFTGQSGYWNIFIEGNKQYQVSLEDSETGNIARIKNKIEGIEQEAKQFEALGSNLQKRKGQIETKIEQVFEKTDELREKQNRLVTIQNEIGLDKKKSDQIIIQDENDEDDGDPTISVPSRDGGFAGYGRPTAPATAQVSAIVKEDMSTGSAAADLWLRRTKGFTQNTTPGMFKKFATAVYSFARQFHYLPELPKTSDFADIREAFRATEEIAKLAYNNSIEKMKWALAPVEGISTEARKRVEAVRMKLIADDLSEDMQKGVDLPPGLEAADVIAMKDRADQLYNTYPSVREAYDRIREATSEITDMLIEEGMLDEEKAKEFYFPHRVIKYLREQDNFFGIPNKKPTEYKKGYLKERKGGADYSTDVLERLVEHWATVRRDIEYQRFLQKTLKAEQAKQFKKEYPDWEQGDEIPAGYKEVTVLPGRFYYKTGGVSEDMASALLSQNLDLIEATMQQEAQEGKTSVRTVLALGKKRSYIVREPIARQIHDMPTLPISSNGLYNAVKTANGFIKGNILFNPLYAVPFHITNFVGDAYKVSIALPSALEPKYVSMLVKQVIASHEGTKSDMFDNAQKYGVIGSGWIGVDVPSLKALIPEIERAEISGAGKALGNKAKRAWNVIKKIGTIREDVLRYATFARLMDLQQQNIDITKYATKDTDIVRGLADPAVKAAKVARDILGDYTAIGKSGRILADLAVPFYRWMHLNLPWWPRLMKEYAKRGQAGTMAYAAMAASAPYIIAMMWNYGDDDRRKMEQALPPWKRWNFHINIASNGKTYYLPLPFDDIVNFLGIPEHISDFQRFARGMITGPELTKRIGINAVYEPGMIGVNSIGGVAGVARDLIGLQTYPDIKPWLVTDWDRNGLNVAKDIFGAPAQLLDAIERDGWDGTKTIDTLNRAWLPMRPFTNDPDQIRQRLLGSIYKRSEKGHQKGAAHKGKQRQVDILRIQLEGAD